MVTLKKHSIAIRVCIPIAVIILANALNFTDMWRAQGGVFNAIVTVVYLAFWYISLTSKSKVTAKFTIAIGALTFVFALLLTLSSLTGVFGASYLALPLVAPLYGAIVFFNKSASAIPACLTLLAIATLWLVAGIASYTLRRERN